MKKLNDIKIFLLDMDGTFYLGNRLIDGSAEFIDTLDKLDKRYIFLTNNSSKSKKVYKDKLNSLGCVVDEEIIFTSGEATSIYLNSIKANPKVFLLGTPALEEAFIKEGIEVVNKSDEKPEFVVMGFDTTLTYEKLWKACDYIREGIPYIATHPDFNCPLDGDKVMPDIGAMIAFVEASTGQEPYVIGKPNKEIIDAICKKYDIDKEEIAMVGDRLYTDILTGTNAGITSILVLSGETKIEDYENSDINADYIFPSLKEIGEILNGEN